MDDITIINSIISTLIYLLFCNYFETSYLSNGDVTGFELVFTSFFLELINRYFTAIEL